MNRAEHGQGGAFWKFGEVHLQTSCFPRRILMTAHTRKANALIDPYTIHPLKVIGLGNLCAKRTKLLHPQFSELFVRDEFHMSAMRVMPNTSAEARRATDVRLQTGAATPALPPT